MASVFVLLEAFTRKEAAALGFFPCATASFVRFMAFYTMYFIFLVRGFMVWSKFYFSVVSTVTPDSDKRFPHNMPDNKLLLCE